MIGLGPSHRYYLYRKPTDMRKSFDGLCALVHSGLGKDPISGDVFVFVSRQRTHIRLPIWDRSGFALFYKRLEAGTFELLKSDKTTWAQMVLLLEGISLKSLKYGCRYVVRG